MLEWLKRHAWKACKRLKRFGGSNPPLSANKNGSRLMVEGRIFFMLFLFLFFSSAYFAIMLMTV